MSKQNSILKQAIAEARELKEGAYANAQNVLKEDFMLEARSSVKQFVEAQLNELDEECPEGEDSMDMELEGYEEMDESLFAEEDDVDYEEEDDDAEDDGFDFASLGDDEDELDESAITEADLEEAVAAALREVDAPPVGEMEVVDPDKRADSRGMMKNDKTEDGWENKEADKSSTPEVYGGGTYHEGYKRKIAALVAENVKLRKSLKVLSKSLNETKLFNAKVLYTHKLLQVEGLTPKARKQIMTSMDKVKSLSEAQNTFNTLNEVLGVLSEAKKSRKTSKAPLSEALGLGNTDGKGVSDVDAKHLDTINEASDPFSMSRMQKLAGIL